MKTRRVHNPYGGNVLGINAATEDDVGVNCGDQSRAVNLGGGFISNNDNGSFASSATTTVTASSSGGAPLHLLPYYSSSSSSYPSCSHIHQACDQQSSTAGASMSATSAYSNYYNNCSSSHSDPPYANYHPHQQNSQQVFPEQQTYGQEEGGRGGEDNHQPTTYSAYSNYYASPSSYEQPQGSQQPLYNYQPDHFSAVCREEPRHYADANQGVNSSRSATTYWSVAIADELEPKIYSYGSSDGDLLAQEESCSLGPQLSLGCKVVVPLDRGVELGTVIGKIDPLAIRASSSSYYGLDLISGREEGGGGGGGAKKRSNKKQQQCSHDGRGSTTTSTSTSYPAIIRRATEEEIRRVEQQLAVEAAEISPVVGAIIDKFGQGRMHFHGCRYQLDESRLLIRYSYVVSRVYFVSLLRMLNQRFKCRIWMVRVPWDGDRPHSSCITTTTTTTTIPTAAGSSQLELEQQEELEQGVEDELDDELDGRPGGSPLSQNSSTPTLGGVTSNSSSSCTTTSSSVACASSTPLVLHQVL